VYRPLSKAPAISGWKLALVIIAAIAALACCGGLVANAVTSGDEEPDADRVLVRDRTADTRPDLPTDVIRPTESKARTVTYRISGDGRGSVTYASDLQSFSTSQETDVPLPWTKELTAPEGLSYPSITAQRGSGGPGTITCTIEVDGKEIKKSESSGPYAVVSCNAQI
jgi:hypothetical protein